MPPPFMRWVLATLETSAVSDREPAHNAGDEPTAALSGRCELGWLHRRPQWRVRLDRDGSRDRLRRAVQRIRHGRHGAEDVSDDDRPGRERCYARPLSRLLLADASSRDPPWCPHLQRRSARRRCRAESETRSGHLAVRRRLALPVTARRTPRGHRRSGCDASAPRHRDPAPSAWSVDQARTGGPENTSEERDCRARVFAARRRRSGSAHSLHQGQTDSSEEGWVSEESDSNKKTLEPFSLPCSGHYLTFSPNLG